MQAQPLKPASLAALPTHVFGQPAQGRGCQRRACCYPDEAVWRPLGTWKACVSMARSFLTCTMHHGTWCPHMHHVPWHVVFPSWHVVGVLVLDLSVLLLSTTYLVSPVVPIKTSTVLSSVVQCCSVLSRVGQRWSVLSSVVQCCSVLASCPVVSSVVQCCPVLSSVGQCCPVLSCVVQCCPVVSCDVLCWPVLASVGQCCPTKDGVPKRGPWTWSWVTDAVPRL